MKRILSVVTAMLLGVVGLNAAGTSAGTVVENTVTLNYSVGTVPQSAVTADDTFIVDRIIDVVIAVNNSGVETQPGSTQVKLGFTVGNEGNDAETWTLSLAENGSDDFDVDGLANCHLFDSSGADLGVLSQDIAFGVDDNKTFEVACDMPTDAKDGESAEVFLVATIKDRSNDTGTADTQGTVLADAQNVYAEGASDNSDAKHDGHFTKGGTYTILSAEVGFTKSSIVISDESGTAEAHRIPGAVVRYCFDITNSGSAIAENVRLTEDLTLTNKDKLDYVKSGIVIQDIGTCDCAAVTDVSGTPTASATTVNIPESTDGIDIPSSKQACGYLEATIK